MENLELTTIENLLDRYAQYQLEDSRKFTGFENRSKKTIQIATE